jgi:aryl-alcohol dehydrogenase-like predicted oxidoreductase
MKSLDLLGIDCLDLLFLHEPQCVPSRDIETVLETLKTIKDDGLTKMLGVGGNPSDSFRPYITQENFQVVSGFCKMDACNLSAFDKDIPHIKKQNIAYYAASSLHFSLLGNRFEDYKNKISVGDYISYKDVNNALQVNDIAKKHNLTLSKLSQRYLFSITEASRVVIGARKINQIESTINDWKEGALNKDLFDEVTATILE